MGEKNQQSAGWPNGKALDYESRDCRFDPCVGHFFFCLFILIFFFTTSIQLTVYTAILNGIK